MEYKIKNNYNEIARTYAFMNTYRRLTSEREYLDRVKYSAMPRVGGKYLIK